jgi:NitT/TauT family transport system ATP-binding protein
MDAILQAPAQPFVVISKLSKSFAPHNSKKNKREVVFEDFTLTLGEGELITVFGPNGSGKTTLLNLLAGLIEPDSGTILIGGRQPSLGLATYLFQNFKDSLFPWRTVEGNLLFPLECQISDKKEQRRRLLDFIQEFEFKIPLQARVYELSIGQQQMVSLARALITRPRFLLMDEPFSALDFHIRRFMQEKLLGYWKESGATLLLVTHEIDDAIYLGQRLILFPPRPITTVGEMTIPLALPRQREMLYTQDYFQIRSEALRFFDEKDKLNK